MSEVAPGDIIIGSGWQQGADGYAGNAVDEGRIISNSSEGVQDNSSLVEIQRSHPEMAAFRYVVFWNYYSSKSLANAGFNSDEPRLPAGQTGGGQRTAGMAPSKTALSGGNPRTTAQEAPATQKANPEPGKPTEERAADEYQRHKAAADSARSIAAELQRRAYILENGTESNYRQLMFQQYGINNPELTKIAAYFAEKFHDQATLNWLKLQHPADRTRHVSQSIPSKVQMVKGAREAWARRLWIGAGLSSCCVRSSFECSQTLGAVKCRHPKL
jgi:hypothetical protein